jgi:hypothetical protein
LLKLNLLIINFSQSRQLVSAKVAAVPLAANVPVARMIAPNSPLSQPSDVWQVIILDKEEPALLFLV